LAHTRIIVFYAASVENEAEYSFNVNPIPLSRNFAADTIFMGLFNIYVGAIIEWLRQCALFECVEIPDVF
jgi:hypothetical protein